MRRTLVIALASAAVVSCQRGDSPDAKAAPSKPAGAVYFWFDSSAISAAGNNFYGAYVYERLLPAFLPGKQPAGSSFAFADGDYLPQRPVTVPTEGADEARVLAQALELGSIAYVVGVFAYGGASFADVDRALKAEAVTGYLGMTSTPGVTLEEFLVQREALSLPVAFKLEGKKIRKAEFGLLGDDRLRALGFEP